MPNIGSVYQADTSLNTTHQSEEFGERKYKTQLCQQWTERGVCKYGEHCNFAHGHQERSQFVRHIVESDKLKTKNCRVFYKDNVCMYGSGCIFRHEHRGYTQLFRHYYTPHLIALEQLFDSSAD